MSKIPNEQPPIEPTRLREWLSRIVILINAALEDKDNLEPTGQMPGTIYDGMTKYFSVIILPDITHVGPWIVVEGVWKPLTTG